MLAALLSCAACSASAAEPAPTTTTEAAGATATSSSIATSTSTTASPAVTSTTVAPTTTVALPVPAPAPADGAPPEPRLELGTIEIPRIGVSQTLFEGIGLSTLDLGPGHWPGSAMPGQLGNVVVGGHRTSHLRPFRHLEQLQPGDEVIFATAAGRFVYTVEGTEVVTPDTMRIIDQTNARTATLFACEPPHSTTYRMVVHLALVAPQ